MFEGRRTWSCVAAPIQGAACPPPQPAGPRQRPTARFPRRLLAGQPVQVPRPARRHLRAPGCRRPVSRHGRTPAVRVRNDAGPRRRRHGFWGESYAHCSAPTPTLYADRDRAGQHPAHAPALPPSPWNRRRRAGASSRQTCGSQRRRNGAQATSSSGEAMTIAKATAKLIKVILPVRSMRMGSVWMPQLHTARCTAKPSTYAVHCLRDAGRQRCRVPRTST